MTAVTRLCASVAARTGAEARARAAALPAEVPLVELRADALDPGRAASGEWAALAQAEGREWVFTWRSPEEGGRLPRPEGALRRAVEAGFRWIDVEARDLERGDPEALSVPAERRWVSRHLVLPPRDAHEVVAAWRGVRRHPAALHKLAVNAHRFEVNDWVLALAAEAGEGGGPPATVFAMGWTGHVSRILGHLEGNAVTFVAADPADPTAAGQPTVAQLTGIYGLSSLPPQPRLYGVLGHPAHRSLSPRIHNHAFRRSGERALYLPLESPDPEPVVEWVRRGRLRGVSVTAPFKERAAALVDRPEPGVRRTGAANTVWLEDGLLHGANTDLEAARELLAEAGISAGHPVAVLGAGGAGAAASAAALDLGAEVSVFNRGDARGRALAARLNVRYGGDGEGFRPAGFRAVVVALPPGAGTRAADRARPEDLAGVAVLDLGYGDEPTPWERAAARAEARFTGGREFLVRQAGGQFRRWMRRRLDPAVFAEGLRP